MSLFAIESMWRLDFGLIISLGVNCMSHADLARLTLEGLAIGESWRDLATQVVHGRSYGNDAAMRGRAHRGRHCRGGC